jgi:hypothetical protein
MSSPELSVASSNESNKQTDLILVSTDAALVQELISLANMQNQPSKVVGLYKQLSNNTHFREERSYFVNLRICRGRLRYDYRKLNIPRRRRWCSRLLHLLQIF